MEIVFRTIKITAGMLQEFEIIQTNATDEVIVENLKYISNGEDEGIAVPQNPYFIIQKYGYMVNVLGCQDDFSYEQVDNLVIDKQFDFYTI